MHRIKKQTLNINFALGSSSYEIQEQLGRICRQTLPEALEKVCNAICKEKYWIKVDKISLDLGILPVAELEGKMQEKTVEKLTETLTNAIRIENSHLNNTKGQENSPASPIVLLKYFLSTGVLPKWVDNRSITLEQLLDQAIDTTPEALSRFLRNAPHKNTLYKRLAGILNQQQLKALAKLLTGNTAFEASIAALFSPANKGATTEQAQLLKLKEALLFYLMEYNPNNAFPEQRITEIATHPGKEKPENKTDKNKPEASVETLKYFLSTGVLPEWIDSGSISPEQLLDQAMDSAPEALSCFLRNAPHKNILYKRLAGLLNPQQLKTLAVLLTKTNAFDTLIDELFPPGKTVSESDQANALKVKESLLSYWLHDGLTSKKTPDTDIVERIRKGEIFNEDILEDTSIQKTEKQDLIHSKALPKPDDNNQQEMFRANDVQACTVHNAGLVLLWPGIPPLLETCGLTQENIFVSEAAAERAVMLLQYAADGRTEVPEFELPLNKILCGLPIDAVVAPAFTPTAAEKAAVEDLLQTILAEWSVMKGSSPEALQVNYLQRTGTITPQGEHWQLHIERQIADILLDRLPWGTGVIKLPWMKPILYTTW